MGAVVDGAWEFDYISENKSVVVADRNLTHSIMQDINDDSIAGKNISVYI